MDNEVYFMARRAFNSFCRAYSRIKDKDIFNLKKLFLHQIVLIFFNFRLKPMDLKDLRVLRILGKISIKKPLLLRKVIEIRRLDRNLERRKIRWCLNLNFCKNISFLI